MNFRPFWRAGRDFSWPDKPIEETSADRLVREIQQNPASFALEPSYNSNGEFSGVYVEEKTGRPHAAAEDAKRILPNEEIPVNDEQIALLNHVEERIADIEDRISALQKDIAYDCEETTKKISDDKEDDGDLSRHITILENINDSLEALAQRLHTECNHLREIIYLGALAADAEDPPAQKRSAARTEETLQQLLLQFQTIEANYKAGIPIAALSNDIYR